MKAFYWESNLVWGLIDTPQRLTELLALVPNAMSGRESTYSSYYPCFGFRIEHTGTRTLSDYLKETGEET